MKSPDEARWAMRQLFDIRPRVYYLLQDVATEVVRERCHRENWPQGWTRADISIQMLGMVAYGWVETHDENLREALDTGRWSHIR